MNMSMALPLLIVLTPFIAGVLILMTPESRPTIRTAINITTALFTIGMIGLLMMGVESGLNYELRLPLLPDIDLVFHGDSLSLLFVSLSGFLWLFTTIYAIGYFKDSANRSRFFGFFSFCVGATIGLALAGNLITFLIFYELLTLATYPLIAHKGTSASIKSAHVYLTYTLVGGALLLVGVVWLKAIAGPLDFNSAGILSALPNLDQTHLRIIFVLLIAGLGVKAALFPLHGWLPVSMTAPAPVSALLHAVAVVKAGAFGIVRVVYDIYGIEFTRDLGLTIFMAVLAGFTIVYGSIIALRQDDLKKRLAYSTVSQVSYIALGTAIAGPIATIGGLIHLVHQGLMKITLFFCAGNLAETLGVHRVSQLDGAGKRMPLTMAAFTIAALGMIGVPPIAGFISKWYLGVGAMEVQAYWVFAVLAASSLLNAAYFLPIINAVWFKPQTKQWPHEQPKSTLEANWMLLLPPVVTASCALIVGLLALNAFSPLSWATLITSLEYRSNLPNLSGIVPSYETSLSWILIFPAVLVVSMLSLKVRSYAIELIPLSTLPALLGAIWLIDDLTSQVFLTLTATIWLIASIYARTYLATDKNRNRFYTFFVLTMIGNFGVVLSQEISSFVAFFALMSFSAYPLIMHTETTEARSAATTYIKWVVLGEVILFIALAGVAYYSTQVLVATPVLWINALLVAGFGIKAGLATAHVWLPKAHPVAPVPASAVLSAVMVKVGLLGWLRFLPLGEESLPILAQTMTVLGFSSAFLGAIYGALQNNAKTILAYSTISQMGILIAIVGYSLHYPAQWNQLLLVILLFTVHHGFAKAALFMSVGLTKDLGRKTTSTLLVWLVVLIPAIALIGIPLSSGAYVKAAMKGATSEMPIFSSILTLTALSTTLVMGRFIEILRRSSKIETSDASRNWGLLLPTTLIVGLVAIYPYLPLVNVLSEQLNSRYQVDWTTLWPSAFGVFVLWATAKSRKRLGTPPSGDLLVIYQACSRQLSIVNEKVVWLVSALFHRIAVMLNGLVNQALILFRSIESSKRISKPNAVLGIVVAALAFVFSFNLA